MKMKKLELIIAALSPALTLVFLPIMSTPAAILSIVLAPLLWPDCKGVCFLIPGIITTLVPSALFSYLLSLSAIFVINRTISIKKAFYLLAYFLLVYLGIYAVFSYRTYSWESSQKELLNKQLNLNSSDISYEELKFQNMKQVWEPYQSSKFDLTVYVPENSFYNDDNRNIIWLEFFGENYIKNAKVYSSKKFDRNSNYLELRIEPDLQIYEFDSLNAAVDDAIQKINKKNKDHNFVEVINQNVYKIVHEDREFYFIEHGLRTGITYTEYSNQVIILKKGNEYMFWRSYTNFEEGLDLSRVVVSNIEFD